MRDELLNKIASAVDAELARFIKVRAKQSIKHPSHQLLWDSLHDVVLGGGKRLRPYLMVLSYLASGKKYDAKLIPPATGWELIHQCMLIHDDIIDRDTVRHGRLNIGGFYREHYQKLGVNDTAAGHYADGAALLAGDLALSGAYQLILASDFSPSVKDAVLNTFGEALDAVALGELQDTEAAFMSNEAKNALLIAELKTASYSFVGPLKTGAQLANMDKTAVDDFGRYGNALGIAFQLRDDWLGVFGDPKIYGKSVNSDILEGKRTLLVEYAYEMADAHGQTTLHATLGNLDASATDIETVRQIINECGARQRVEAEIDTYTQTAHKILNNISMPDDVRERFQSLETYLLDRKK